jgi:hypothetical protein
MTARRRATIGPVDPRHRSTIVTADPQGWSSQ